MAVIHDKSGSEGHPLNGKEGGTALWLEMVRAAQSLSETGAIDQQLLGHDAGDGYCQVPVREVLETISSRASCYRPMNDLEATATLTALRQLRRPVNAQSLRGSLRDSCGNGNSHFAANGNVAANGNPVGNGNRRA